MKISIVADCHLNKSTYKNVKDFQNQHLPFRTADFMKAFQFSVDQTLELKPDFFILLGDVFDNMSPSIDVLSFFNEQLSRISNSGIKCYIMVGNHDFGRRNHILQPLKALNINNIVIVDSPCITKEIDGYNFAFFPHSLDVEIGDKSMRQSYLDFSQTLEGLDKSKTLFFGHFGVQGAIINQWLDKPDGLITELFMKRTKKNVIRNSESDAITLLDLEQTNASYVFLGDYHKHQSFDIPNQIAMYVGSLEKSDFNEIGQKKGFIYFDSNLEKDKKIGTAKYIEYKNSRPFLEIRGNWNQIREAAKGINQKIEDYNGAIVKVVFSGKTNELVDFNSNIDKLKRWISEKIKPAHLYVEMNIEESLSEDSLKEEETQSKQIENILNNGNLIISDLEPIISDIIDDLSGTAEYKNSLKDLAKTILQEAKS